MSANTSGAKTDVTHSFPLINSTSTSRRQYLENELRTAREKMQNLGGVTAKRPGGIRRLIAMRKKGMEMEDLEGQLDTSRDQNAILGARIAELEAQMHSRWALGLSDEPPPGYTC
jgi:hypothetical protein